MKEIIIKTKQCLIILPFDFSCYHNYLEDQSTAISKQVLSWISIHETLLTLINFFYKNFPYLNFNCTSLQLFKIKLITIIKICYTRKLTTVPGWGNNRHIQRVWLNLVQGHKFDCLVSRA